MWRCPICETNNNDQDQYCPVCGSGREASLPTEKTAYQPRENGEDTAYGDQDTYTWQPAAPAETYEPDEPYDRAARYEGSYASGGTVVRHRRIWPFLVAVLAVILLSAGSGVLILENMYGSACEARDGGEYDAAYQKFSGISWYRDSRAQADRCLSDSHIAAGDALMAEADFDGARAEYAQAASDDGADRILESWIMQAALYEESGDHSAAYEALSNVSDTAKGAQALDDMYARHARTLLGAEDISGARERAALIAADDMRSSLLFEIYIAEAEILMKNDDTDGAAVAYQAALAYAADDEARAAAESGAAKAAERAAEIADEAEAQRQEDERLAKEQAELAEQARIEEMYQAAAEKAKNGDLCGAISDYMQLNGYSDSVSRMRTLSAELSGHTAAGGMHYLQLSGGKVAAYGNNFYGQCAVGAYSDVIQVAAGSHHSVLLMADGTVAALGDNSYGQCNVQEWSGITAVAAGSYHTVGLKFDGTVVTAGWDAYGQRGTRTWTDIVAIAAGERHTVGLKSDGSVVAAGDNSEGRCNVTGWQDIVQVACGYAHTVGLKSDGSVVAVGWDEYGQLNVESAQNVICVAAGKYHTACLLSDGAVYACGNDFYGQCSVQDIGAVAISANSAYTMCVSGEGVPVIFGRLYEQCVPGSPDAYVRMLQQTLKDMGYYAGAVNGSFSDELTSAIAAAESAYGIPADGIADPAFLEAIY